ncbi:hypothetical protein PAPYR_8695 [Paratrimastix pyriformis]|uniref:Haloacid dehalogenase-like hydrolase n=1 Tax=Paratrimastix pyriformis TaxID=342808 RepID=A0ABQ8UE70_9EUKA|nr:hypothetical protein PAPYR_8695 [Paratrimastix pyriformis]
MWTRLFLVLGVAALATAASPRALCSDFDYTKIQLITFDGFAALFDTYGSLPPNFRQIFDELAVSNETIVEFTKEWLGYYSTENWMYYNTLTMSPGVRSASDPFQYLMRTGLANVMSHLRISATTDQVEQLMKAWGHLNPHPGVVDTLVKLNGRGIHVGILSNADDTTQAIMATHLAPARIDYYFTTTKAGVFKPHPELYGLTEQAGYAKNTVLHVAGGGFDAMGARGFGIFAASCGGGDFCPTPDPTLQPCFFLSGVPDLAKLFHL